MAPSQKHKAGIYRKDAQSPFDRIGGTIDRVRNEQLLLSAYSY